ncbi:MAG TPA: hypothetical protein VGV89_06245 [Thermoplasmata archaeon]|nr:hypothetical protein [Thermoplasmata archaeon]
MSDAALPELSLRDLRELQSRVLSLYLAVIIIAFVAIGILLAYVIGLGPLVGPGVEQSFGIAVSMMFLLGALLAHVMDRAYREWPLGRRIHTHAGPPVTDLTVAGALRILVILGAAIAVAYVVYGVITS